MTRKRVLALALAASALLAGCSAATEPVTNVTSSSAKLHASVSWPADLGVVYWFETRPSGAQTWTRDDVRRAGPFDRAGSGNIAEDVSGLSPATTYQFRLCTYLTDADDWRSPTLCFDSRGRANGSNYDSFRTSARVAAGPTAFPNPQTTGTPPGWTPTQTRSTSLTVTQDGAEVQDIRFTNGANINVQARNVTIRRVELQGGVINNDIGPCGNGLLVEDTTIRPPAGGRSNDGEGVIAYGGYTARRVEIQDRNEGFRVSSAGDCGPVSIEDSFAKIIAPPGCGDWHGDGIQGYDGAAVTVRNVTIDARTSGCYGTAPFFYPRDQGNTRADVNRLLVMGQGYPFRDGMPGSVTGLRIVDGSWIFDPIDVNCSVVAPWEAKIVTIDSNYQVTGIVRDQPCNTQSGA